MRTLHLAFVAALCVAGLTACSSSVEIGADDAGTTPPPDGRTGEPCGANTCTDGEYCCNASCGICAPQGDTCTTIACPDPVVCNGEVCDGPDAVCCPGCGPGESFCGSGGCPPIACPSDCFTDADCGGGRCCEGCTAGELGFCVGAGEACPDLFCGTPCGDSTCGAGDQCCPAGCPGMSDFCSPADMMCPIPACPPPSCEPQRAWGVGDCEAVLGVRWNGYFCEGISGCECVGDDCGAVYTSTTECESFHSGVCPGTPGCSADADCPATMYCDPCAHGSCPFCADCVADCAPTPCASEPEPACDEVRPECGDGVAVVRDGCWLCVDRATCAPITSG